jgi:hypothetical protein
MQLFLRFAVLSICIELLFAICCTSEDRNSTEYQKQQDKLSRETSPVGKVKILVKMSELDIGEVSHWVKKGNLPEANRFLSQYVAVIRQANETLKSSNRNAQKNPAGFKDFEISLRRQLRKLLDLKPGYPFDQQQPVNEAIAAVESVKEEMLRAIFGSENTGHRKGDNRKPTEPKEEDP